MPLSPDQRDRLAFDDRGLVPAIVQQHDTGEVLMFAWMDEEAVARTLTSGEAWFWSRSRQELWHKGATSGNTIAVHDVRYDCDGDVLLVLGDVADGVACHTGERSCFHRTLPPAGSDG
jgi:phosphoribosyl-AMP cyclohydrolase